MSDLYQRVIMLERIINDLRRENSSFKAQLAELRQASRVASMSNLIGSGQDNAYGWGWATTAATIASGATGSINLLTESFTSTGITVSALNGYSFSIASSKRVQWRKTASGTYVIVVVDCTP